MKRGDSDGTRTKGKSGVGELLQEPPGSVVSDCAQTPVFFRETDSCVVVPGGSRASFPAQFFFIPLLHTSFLAHSLDAYLLQPLRDVRWVEPHATTDSK
jgi:hypothetical protein